MIIFNKEKTLLNKKKRKIKKELNIFTDEWKEIMYHTKLFNAGNQTFNLYNLQKKDYGYNATILPPYGFSFEHLENIRNIIQDNLGCLFINKINKSRKSSNVNFITKEFNPGRYDLIKTNPWELYLGNTIKKENFIVDMYKTPHLLLSGANNSGKSRMLDCIITTLVSQHNKYNIELFLIQLAKDDLVIYEDCEQTYAFADTLEDAEEIMQYIKEKILPERSKLIKPIRKKGKGNSIIDYNKFYSNNKQPIIYVIFDEMASLMENNGDNKETKKKKQYLVSCAEQIAQYGRALCVYGIFCLQRPTVNNLSSFIKSQANVRVSFRQNNKKSSEVALDDPDIAYQLPIRLAVVELDKYEYLKVPDISDKTIFQHITPSLKPNHRNLFRDLKILHKDNKLNKKLQFKLKTPKKQTKIKKNDDKFNKNNFNKVDPIIKKGKQEKFKKNIMNIPNFVPYNPSNKKLKIIDKTKIPTDAPLSNVNKKEKESNK